MDNEIKLGKDMPIDKPVDPPSPSYPNDPQPNPIPDRPDPAPVPKPPEPKKPPIVDPKPPQTDW